MFKLSPGLPHRVSQTCEQRCCANLSLIREHHPVSEHKHYYAFLAYGIVHECRSGTISVSFSLDYQYPTRKDVEVPLHWAGGLYGAARLTQTPQYFGICLGALHGRPRQHVIRV